MLKVEHLSKNYGKFTAIDDINFEVKESEIFGFVGKNGAGKSTTIRTIMNLITKAGGDVFIDSQKLCKNKTELYQKIGYLPSEIYLYPELKVCDTFAYFSSFYKKDCHQRIDELVSILDLDTTKRIDQLSLGNLKKVGIVLALMHSPKIVVMDEATSGLDPFIQEKFYQILEEEKQKGTCILFSSHNLTEIKKISDRVGIIKDGRLIKVDTVEHLIDKNFYIVTIDSSDLEKIKEDLQIQSDTSKFIYRGDINLLIKVLSKYEVNQLKIEDAPIEEVFKHYYEGDSK